MRGITRDALERMNLQSQSWEYASEMVLKSVHMDLRTTEVPVTFLKDREGRLSHHKRSGWFSPFQAAWINLRAMFVYGSDFFLLKPGLVLTVLGLLLTLPLSFGDLDIGVARAVAELAVPRRRDARRRLPDLLWVHRAGAVRLHGSPQPSMARVFPYTRTVLIAFGLVVLGIALAIPLVVTYSTTTCRSSGPTRSRTTWR